jgi:hypothetical protein
VRRKKCDCRIFVHRPLLNGNGARRRRRRRRREEEIYGDLTTEQESEVTVEEFRLLRYYAM